VNGTQEANSFLLTITMDKNNIKDWEIIDSDLTSYFLVTDAPVTFLQMATTPLQAHLPNGTQVALMHTCALNLPHLPSSAQKAHIIPGLALHFSSWLFNCARQDVK